MHCRGVNYFCPLPCRRLYFRAGDSELDEFYPKATRTLHVGNLRVPPVGSGSSSASSSASTSGLASDLRDKFDGCGEILDVDVKKSGHYAAIQFVDVASVCKAIR